MAPENSTWPSTKDDIDSNLMFDHYLLVLIAMEKIFLKLDLVLAPI